MTPPLGADYSSDADARTGSTELPDTARHLQGLAMAFTPFKLRELELRNRFIKTATYEGMSPGGLPSQKLIRHHQALARGGVGMTTVAYCAVNAEGRTFEEQLWMHPAAEAPLRALTDAVHEAGGAASIQLGHCGAFSRNRSLPGGRPLGPSRSLNEYGLLQGLPFSRAMTYRDLKRSSHDFATAAQRAVACGFDAVELHLGHGYLLSQFLSPFANRRRDAYGGTLANRLRFPLEVVLAVRAAVGDRIPVLAKINLSDGLKGGLQLEEAVEVGRALEAAGCDALVTSGGYTSRTPFFLMRGKVPLRQMITVEQSLAQKIALALFGPFYIKRYPFRENFFQEDARVLRSEVSLPLALLGGIVSAEGIAGAMNDGFELVALGRALIHDPNFVRRLEAGEVIRSGCDHCNRCVAEMDRDGVRCVLEDAPGRDFA